MTSRLRKYFDDIDCSQVGYKTAYSYRKLGMSCIKRKEKKRNDKDFKRLPEGEWAKLL